MLAEIRRILWENWDPIGVRGIGPDDEYDSYAFHVFGMLNEGASEESVSDYLRWAAVEHMGLGGNGRDQAIAQDARLISKSILSLKGRT